MLYDDEDTQPAQVSYQWDPARLKFADVSRWVKLASARAYADACLAKVIGIKISEGEHWSGTPEARAAVELCVSVGLIVVGYQYGPYHPEAFLQAFPPRPGCIPSLDFEFSQTNRDDGNIRLRAAERWVMAVGDAWQRLPWFYGRSAWQALGSPANTVIRHCPYWGPQYGSRMTTPRGVGRAVAWQYSDGVAGPAPRTHAGIEIVAGVTKPCDMSVLLCTPDELRAMAQAHG